jgi:NAD(P)-dependent dehydrogenase (short-subunit alcohol dehydrogenase family)
MKIVMVIGATGIIGSAVAHALEMKKYEVIRVSRTGTIKVDLEDPSSIETLFTSVSNIEAVVVTAGSGTLKPFAQITEEDFTNGMKSKALGQIALLQCAADHLPDGGSITLTSGNMFENLIPGSSISAFVNNGLDGFVRAVASELPRGIRVNIVSPGWVKESLERMDSDVRRSLGLENVMGTAASKVAQAYIQSIEGTEQGKKITPQKQ